MPSIELKYPSPFSIKSPLGDMIKNRRSTKSFVANQTIDPEILQEILTLGSLAPSGFNLQPWRFVIVETDVGKEKIYSCAFEQEQIKQAAAVLICCGERQVFLPSYIEEVLELGLQAGTMTEEHAQFLRQTIPTFHKFQPSFTNIETWINRQVMIAVTQMMLVAKSLDIDSCPMEGLVGTAIKEIFALPESWDVCCLLALGYAEKNRNFGGRFNLNKTCFQESYFMP